jgi:hypothetical protein
MNWSDIPWNPSGRVLKQFAALGALFFAGLSFWDAVLAPDRQLFRGVFFAGSAAVVGSLGFFRPRALRPIYVGWMIVAFPPGWLVSRLALGTVFYGIFTPLALALRLVGRRSLECRLQPEQPSYWTARQGMPEAPSYFRQF